MPRNDSFLDSKLSAFNSEEDFLGALFDQAPLGFAIFDSSHRIIYANRLFGTINESSQILSPHLQKGLLPSLQRSFSTGETISNLEISTRPNGGPVQHFLVTIFPIGMEHKQVLTILMDITERIETKAELEWNQKRLQNITDIIPLLVTYIDRSYHYRFNNRTYDEWFGTPHQAIRGKHAEEVLGKIGFAICKPWMDRAMQGETVVWERPLMHPKKGWRQVEIYYAPDIDSSGYIHGFVAAVRDVTDERELHRQLEYQHRRLRDLLSQVPALIWESWKQPNSTLMRMNFISDHIEKMLGYTPEEWLALPDFWFSICHPDDLEKVRRGLSGFEKSGHGGTLEFRFVARDGRVIDVASYIEVITERMEGPVGFRGVTLDITERKKMESDLQQTSENLKKAVRIRDDFLSIAAHELRTPITTIQLQNQMLMRLAKSKEGLERIEPEQLRRILDNSSRQIQNLTRLIDELLDTTHISAGKLSLRRSWCDLNEIVRAALENYRPKIEPDSAPIIFQTAQEKIIGCWDRFRVEQVVSNLVSNAIKYGGKSKIMIHTWIMDDKALLEIQDEGIGIDEQDQKRIFNRFERAVDHKHISGWGLGLYISREIINAHDGTIQVRSSPRRGSTFTIALPIRSSAHSETDHNSVEP